MQTYTSGMSSPRKVIVIGYHTSKLVRLVRAHDERWAVSRGRSESKLKEAVKHLALPADLIVLEGHGVLREGKPMFRGSNSAADEIEFAPPEIVAPQLIMSFCHGGSGPFRSRITEQSPDTQVLGPRDEVNWKGCADLVYEVIESYLEGVDLDAALRSAQGRGHRDAELWELWP
ncbi:hypothetical protein AXK60_08540 [Tsukamurella pseudospumae]|uniref:CHAT domain-containing protein n=2 Tax=Tsukamurella pseudospumae TaxID=239498 RepID=A0A138AE40_9ACTN|nr:hypothetical protein AXK60_08540 [Tsukamurella pseudospumae]